MANVKGNYLGLIYDTITKYNDKHHTPLPNLKIIAAINRVMREEEVESNIVTVDTFSPHKKEG